MRLVALKAHDYGGRAIRVGQQYEAAEPYADALVRARVSKYAVFSVKPTLPPLEHRVARYETKEQKPEPMASEKPARAKRVYRRKEMHPVE